MILLGNQFPGLIIADRVGKHSNRALQVLEVPVGETRAIRACWHCPHILRVVAKLLSNSLL